MDAYKGNCTDQCGQDGGYTYLMRNMDRKSVGPYTTNTTQPGLRRKNLGKEKVSDNITKITKIMVTQSGWGLPSPSWLSVGLISFGLPCRAHEGVWMVIWTTGWTSFVCCLKPVT